MESGGMNYFPWWLVENHHIEATILSLLQRQIVMNITVLKGQSKKKQTVDQKIMYLQDHLVVRKKRKTVLMIVYRVLQSHFWRKTPLIPFRSSFQRKMSDLDGIKCK